MSSALLIAALTIVMLSWVARQARLLTTRGAIAAASVGLTTVFLGGYQSLLLLFVFFSTSNLLGRWRKKQKESLGYEKGGSRDEWQVLANGGPAVLGLVLSRLVLGAHHGLQTGIVLFAAGMAESNADTWATEIGSASRTTARSILTGKPVAGGQSGGISLPGTTASLGASILIAIVYQITSGEGHPWKVALIVSAAGFAGALFDSFLGASLQAQFESGKSQIIEFPGENTTLVHGVSWLRNDGVNFIAGVVAVILAYVLIAHT